MTTRRTVLSRLLAGLPAGYIGNAYASDAPESSTVKFGIIALTDCASIVMAHELGLFKNPHRGRVCPLSLGYDPGHPLLAERPVDPTRTPFSSPCPGVGTGADRGRDHLRTDAGD